MKSMAFPWTPAAKPARRSFLAGLSAALTAPAAVALVAPVQATTPELQESPELLSIGEQLSTLLDAYRDAAARKLEAVEFFERTRPTLPEGLARSPAERRYGDLCWPETDIHGESVYLAEEDYQRYIYRWKNVQSYILLREIPARTREGKWLRKIARLARTYERGTKATRKTSGFDDRSREAQQIALQIEGLAKQLYTEAELKPRTKKGLAIYASALKAIEKCSESDDARSLGHLARLGSVIAEALVRTPIKQL